MDRKAWIVVTLCVIGMALNAYYAAKNRPPPQAKPAEVEQAISETGKPADITEPEIAKAAVPAALEKTHTLTSGTVRFEFSTKGGGVSTAVLTSKGDEIVANKHGKEAVGALRMGPSTRDNLSYQIVESTEKRVSFEAKTPEGLTIRKSYAVTDGDKSDEHLLALTVTLTNNGQGTYASSDLFLYAGAAASLRPDDILHPSFFWNDSGNADSKETAWFEPGYFSTNPPEYLQSYNNLRWGGVMSRFYANIISTKEGVENQPGKLWAQRFLVDHSGDAFKGTSGALKDYAMEGAVGLPPVELQAGASKTLEYEVYLGPKEYHRLAKIERQRRFVMFYGMWSAISRVFINLLNWLHDHLGSWGWAIVMLTIIVRLFLWPFHAKSQRAMKRMSKLAPLMKDIQAKYKDDPQRQSQETMKLYKDYGVNPLGGCLPMLLQIPIFFGFFSMLGSAAELRGEAFAWVRDLSLPDTVTHILGYPLNPLPLVMGITMFLQMKLTPQPATVDKMQQRIFMFMPFIFLIFCYTYASALALYWTTQNIFSIVQSYIMRKMGTDDSGPLEKVKRAPVGPPPVNPFAQPGQKHKDKKKSSGPRLGGR